MPFSYPCLPFRQNADAPLLCVFHAPAADILQWAAVDRHPDRERAAQRGLSKAKADAIRRFMTDPRNAIPTTVTVAVKPGIPVIFADGGAEGGEWNEGTGGLIARFVLPATTADQPAAEKPAVVIDGQHRLEGIKQYSPTTPVTVVALIGADDMEVAFQFLVINQKSSKVPSDHIRSLTSVYNADQLEARLRTAKLTQYPNLEFVSLADSDPDSPFRGLIRWHSNRVGRQVVPPAAIEGAVGYIQQKEVRQLDDTDALAAFFFSMWRAVRERWPDVWADGTKLLDKIGVICMTQYLTDALVQLSDLGILELTDPDKVRERVTGMLQYQEPRLWRAEWTASSYDTKAGRLLVVEALVRVARNLRQGQPWYEEVRLIDPSSVGSPSPLTDTNPSTSPEV